MIPPEIIVHHIREATSKAQPRKGYRRPEQYVELSVVLSAAIGGAMFAVIVARRHRLYLISNNNNNIHQ